MKKIIAFFSLLVVVSIGIKILSKKAQFNPFAYSEKQIADAERICADKVFSKENISEIILSLCYQLGRGKETCQFTGFEILLGRDQWLVKCEREELEKMGSL